MKFMHVCKICGFKSRYLSNMAIHMTENHVDSIPYEGHWSEETKA